VDVVPRQSIAKGWETYTLRVPTETAAATVKLLVTVPSAFEIEMVEHRQDWKIDTVRDARGFVREMTWSGGRVPTKTFDEPLLTSFPRYWLPPPSSPGENGERFPFHGKMQTNR
jgi:uncharacterized protein YcnI